jgi:hypothetical protein
MVAHDIIQVSRKRKLSFEDPLPGDQVVSAVAAAAMVLALRDKLEVVPVMVAGTFTFAARQEVDSVLALNPNRDIIARVEREFLAWVTETTPQFYWGGFHAENNWVFAKVENRAPIIREVP